MRDSNGIMVARRKMIASVLRRLAYQIENLYDLDDAEQQVSYDKNWGWDRMSSDSIIITRMDKDSISSHLLEMASDLKINKVVAGNKKYEDTSTLFKCELPFKLYVRVPSGDEDLLAEEIDAFTDEGMEFSCNPLEFGNADEVVISIYDSGKDEMGSYLLGTKTWTYENTSSTEGKEEDETLFDDLD